MEMLNSGTGGQTINNSDLKVIGTIYHLILNMINFHKQVCMKGIVHSRILTAVQIFFASK